MTITWEYVDADGLPPINLNWCEQEIFLSVDGGRTNARRITLALDPTSRSYDWIVPNTPSDRAVLDIHYGCESSDSPAEIPNKQIQAPFRILQPVKADAEVLLDRLPVSVHPGEALSLNWSSTILNPGPYTLAVSYDRGGDFVELGTTNATAFTWNVPAQFSGTLTFRVSTTDRSGTVYESAVTPASTTTVRR